MRKRVSQKLEPRRSSSAWRLAGDEHIAVETEEILAAASQLPQVARPLLGFSTPEIPPGRDEPHDQVDHPVAVGVLVIMSIEEREHRRPLDPEPGATEHQ